MQYKYLSYYILRFKKLLQQSIFKNRGKMEPENINKLTNQNIIVTNSVPITTTIQKTNNKSQINQANQGKCKNVASCQTSMLENGNNFVILNRSGHCSFVYKNFIYFYGGFQNINKNQSQNMVENQQQNLGVLKKQSLWNSFHKFNLNTKQFSRQLINYGNSACYFTNICHFGYLLLGNILYIYGGINYQNGYRRNAQMCSINLESGSIKRYQSKTSLASIPSPRLNPVIVSIQKSVLMLMGGEVFGNSVNYSNFVNDMYIFKIQTKTWTKIEDSYHIKYPILIKPSLINFGDNCVYMLGGKRSILKNDGSSVQEIDNWQIYRLRVVNKTINSKSDCCLKRVFSSNYIPHNHTFVKILKYLDKGIVAATKILGSENNNMHIWYFDPTSLIWCQITSYFEQNDVFIQSQNIDDILVTTQKLIVVLKNGYIRQLPFNFSTIQNTTKQGLSLNKFNINLCSNCEQEQIYGNIQKNLIPAEHFQEFSSPLQFPYAAIGLLVDSAVFSNAKVCNVSFNVGSIGRQSVNQNNKNVYMIIQDNGSPSNIWTSQTKPYQFVNSITSFNSTILLEDVMIDEDNKKMFSKSMKEIDDKQKTLQREFNNFLKNQTKINGSNNQAIQNGSAALFKNEKDFQKQQHQYMQRKQKLQYKKKLLETQQKCKKLSNNIKLAGVRLGDSIVYACKQKKNQEGAEQNANDKTDKTDKDVRRYFFMRKQKCPQTGKLFYVSYAYVTENGNAADPKMQNIIKLCAKEFKKQLKIVTQRLKNANTVILVSDLKHFFNNQDSNQKNTQKFIPNSKELRLKKKQNDVFYGQTSMLNSLQACNLAKISQSCDISLKTYLALLYLNNQQLSIFLSIRENQLEQINSQPFLNTIDRMLNSKKIIQVSKSLDFSDQCSVVQVYWNPDHNFSHDSTSPINRLGFLANGILIYHRNRLISRYRVELGKLLDNFQANQKYGSTFGYLQIKPQYGVNLYSTDTLYPRLFEKYYSRIQFVNQYMEHKYKQKRTRQKDDSLSGNYQKISKRAKNQ